MEILPVFISISIVFVLFILPFVIFWDREDEGMYILASILKIEEIVCFPVGIIVLGYEIYKSGHWGMSRETTSYIALMWNVLGMFALLLFKFLGSKREGTRIFILLWMCTIGVPVVSVGIIINAMFYN